MVQQLHRHLNVGRGSSNDDQPFALSAGGGGSTVHTYAYSPRFHDFDLACAHMADLVDLGAAFADDAAHKVVGDVYLLGL